MNNQSFIGRERGEPFVARDGALIFELFRGNDIIPRNISIASGRLKPKQKALPHSHNISEEIYYVLFGYGKCRIGEVIEEIEGGDVVYIPVGVIHALENTSATKSMKVLAISSPPYQDSDIFFVD